MVAVPKGLQLFLLKTCGVCVCVLPSKFGIACVSAYFTLHTADLSLGACFAGAATELQGMWELSINKQHHAELELRHLQPVVQHLQHPNVEVSRMCAATLWGLAVNEQSRALLLQLHAVEALLALARHTVTMQCIGDSELLPGDYVAGGKCSQTQRNQLQVRSRSQSRALV